MFKTKEEKIKRKTAFPPQALSMPKWRKINEPLERILETETVVSMESHETPPPSSLDAPASPSQGKKKHVPKEDPRKEEDRSPWLSPVPILIELILFMALVSHRLVLLQGVLLVLVAKIALVVFPWLVFIVTSKDTTTLVRGVRTYHELLMREINNTIHGGKMRRAMEGAAISNMNYSKNMGLSIYRRRNAEMNRNARKHLQQQRERLLRHKHEK